MPQTFNGHFNVLDASISDESFVEKNRLNFNPGSYDGFIRQNY